jgi:hypothetical protein
MIGDILRFLEQPHVHGLIVFDSQPRLMRWVAMNGSSLSTAGAKYATVSMQWHIPSSFSFLTQKVISHPTETHCLRGHLFDHIWYQGEFSDESRRMIDHRLRPSQ